MKYHFIHALRSLVKQNLILIFVLTISGCATVGGIEKGYQKINRENGIDRAEARIIAQHEVLRLERQKDFSISSAKVYNPEEVMKLTIEQFPFVFDHDLYIADKKLKYDHNWYVFLKPKFMNLFSFGYLIILDQKTGVINSAGERNALGEVFNEVMKEPLKNSLTSLTLVTRFYKAKDRMPDNIEELNQFIAALPEDQREGSGPLMNAHIQKISPEKIRIHFPAAQPVQVKKDDADLRAVLGTMTGKITDQFRTLEIIIDPKTKQIQANLIL